MNDFIKKISWAGTGLGAAGVLLSLFLAIEYYGLGSENLGNALCSATGGGNSCDKVAQSAYSAIRGLPLVGDLPVALFGAGFYGTLAFLFFTASRTKEEASLSETFATIRNISILGLVADITLFSISIGFIGTLCLLCAFTYLVTIGIFFLAFFALKQLKPTDSTPIALFQSKFTSLATAFLLSFAVTQFVAKFLARSDSSLANSQTLEKGAVNEMVESYKKSPTLGIKISGNSILGKKEAPITIVKFADFNCGHCAHTSEILHSVLSDYDGMVRVVFQNFPLDGTCNRLVEKPRPEASSCVAATASICAERQGKFEPMYRGLYENQAKGVYHTTTTVLNLANTIGLNASQFKSCLGSAEASKQLMAEIEEAGRLNIQATPSLYINDRAIRSGTPDTKFLKAVLDDLVKNL